DHLKRLAKMRDLYCTGCGYCLPCPVHVDIPGIFAQYNLGRVYGLWPAAKGAYQKILAQGHGADACTECGQCEEKCPQHLSIRKDLQKAHIALTDQS
ncbi:MAG: 4Fe-4S dicluster domain-containing protein, partial [Candidatus Pacebacteria bacterium]|nr:4Fe-4S dicluster domain-containing protein [Candidatus Paceibacterota bacterium]